MQGRIEDIARESFHELMYVTGVGLEDDPKQKQESYGDTDEYKDRYEGHRDYEEKVRMNVREISESCMRTGAFSDAPI